MTQAKNPLHGVTLEKMLTALVEHFGWPGLGERINIKSFNVDPSIASSLKFLRKTAWAREKVESLYLFVQREQVRAARKPVPTAAPFGSWASRVSTELIAGETIRLGQIAVQDDDIFWTEGRPQEQGRNVLVWCDANGRCLDLTPAPLNVRSRVHEYGGGAFSVSRRAGFFVNDADQQVWRLRAGETSQALTNEPGKRHADAVVDAKHKRLICVREDHSAAGAEAVNTIVGIRLSNGAEEVLAQGHDFFSSPCLSPDGSRLAWLSWDHPNMPWDGSELWCADLLAGGALGSVHKIAGSSAESIFQPSWSPRGELHFVSDRSGWWNLYRVRDGEVQALQPMAAEFGEPQWALGLSTYGFDGQGRIVCAYVDAGRSQLAILDADAGRFELIATPFCSIEQLRVGSDFAVFIGGSETAPAAIVRLDLATGATRTLRSSSRATLPVDCISVAQTIEFPTEGGLTAHAFYYPPTNPEYRGPEGARPPLLVATHGGPTGSTSAAFSWNFQYWTSRGFAVVDVDYGGSSGHGRAYRERLNGAWGVVDVDDAVNAARHLVERGLVDAGHVAIRGSSAGGYTTLAALIFRSFFKAGASHYGIGDLEALALDTHKFESRYLDKLVGPYPAARARYLERSPVHHTAQLNSPMILFQGLEDKAVPPAQAQAMFDAVRAKGLPVALLMFEGEQHGFRRASTIKRVLEAELAFYGRIFGFTAAGPTVELAIENL